MMETITNPTPPAKKVKRENAFTNIAYDLRKNKVLMLILLPTLLFFFIFSYLPMVGIYYAFTNYNFQGGLFGSPFVGLNNFKYLFTSGTAWTITSNTVLYNLIFILLGNAMQIATAILLSRVSGRIFTKTTQAIMFLPYFISYVIIGTFAYNMLNYETGVVNTFLKGLGADPYDFYNTPWIWRILVPTFYIWKNLGYGSVIYLAAIMGISDDYYEAAEIDGANIFQQIRFITLPMLKPTFIILFLLALGSIMRGQFDLFFQLIGTNGILFSTTDIIDTFVFRSLRFNVNIGMGTAAGLYQSVFGLIIVVSANYAIRRYDEDFALF